MTDDHINISFSLIIGITIGIASYFLILLSSYFFIKIINRNIRNQRFNTQRLKYYEDYQRQMVINNENSDITADSSPTNIIDDETVTSEDAKKEEKLNLYNNTV
jgi:hypothetical protein